MAKDPVTLGEGMFELYRSLGSLIQKAKTPAARKKVQAQQDALAKTIAQLIEETLDDDDEKYANATAGVQNAIAEVKKAIKGLETITKVVKVAAKAVELAAKLIPAG